ncbi:MAG: hypothetical protein FWD82_04055 [Defluviitaleaceae bacterium]|nr:hypothetical protein [Defluviitaleaceae bacterium]
MAKISQNLDWFVNRSENLDDMSSILKCVFCEKDLTNSKDKGKGGFWHGATGYICVCGECKDTLIHLYIDTLEDVEDLRHLENSEEKRQFILDEVEKIIVKKEHNEIVNAKRAILNSLKLIEALDPQSDWIEALDMLKNKN